VAFLKCGWIGFGGAGEGEIWKGGREGMLLIVGGEDRDGCEGGMNRSQGVKEFAVVSFFRVVLVLGKKCPNI